MQSLEVQISKLHGVTVSPEPMRHYVDGPLYSHLLGYVGQISEEEYTAAQEQYGAANNPYGKDDYIGKTGLEASLDDQLRGKKGVQSVIVNSHEQVVSEVAYQAPITGNNVTLTLDAKLQRAVTDAMRKGLDNAKVKAGVAIVLRVSDGQVLAMVSLPSYDNNLFTRGIKQQEFDTLLHDPTLPMFNRAVGGAYPPGSTYKMITAAAALQEDVVKVDTPLVCPGYIEVPFTANEAKRNLYKDWRAAGHGTINIIEALTVSSDVFFYITAGPHQEDRVIKKSDGTRQIVYTRYYTPGARTAIEFNGLGIERLANYARAFGLGSKTGITLPGESPGLVPDQHWKDSVDPANPWSLGDTLVTAIGQGYNLVTPLQLVNVTAAVANGGTLYKPQLVEKITGPNGELVQGYTPQVLGQVPVSPENLAVVREGMRQVIVNQAKGTAATHITLKSFEWAGKTGTAEFGEPIRIDKGKEVRRAHAWFTAFAPFDKPEIAVVVLLEGGEESLEGSTFAVPVTDEIMKAYFKVDK
jgi:penicillin-binding protein 2